VSAKLKWLLGMLLLSLAVDQGTKAAARAWLRDRPPVVVVRGFVELRYAENLGMAFSAPGDAGPSRAILVLASAAILVALLFAAWRADGEDRRLGAAIGLLVAGGLGNLIDRAAAGRVVDFILLRAGDHAWPTFNVADASLVLGVAALALVRAPKPKLDKV